MKQWTNKSFGTMLKRNGYKIVRQNGNHQIWENKSGKTISVPAVKVNCMMANRLIKEYELEVS